MDNEALKQVFMNLHERIIREVNPDPIIEELFARDVISGDDMNALISKSPDPKLRCRTLLYRLRSSLHPDTFIHLREALLDEYPHIVDEIDKQPASPSTTRPQQQPRMSQFTEGKLL